MSVWPSVRAAVLLRALLRLGWTESTHRKAGSHRTLTREGFPNYTWAFHADVEIGPKMVDRIAKKTGLRPQDL